MVQKKGASLTYTCSIEALRQLILSKDNDIVKISPKGYALSNALDYCCVGLKSNDGSLLSASIWQRGKTNI